MIVNRKIHCAFTIILMMYCFSTYNKPVSICGDEYFLTHAQSYLFLTACAYMVGQTYGPVSNLAAPVLSDHFGFTVEYTSYFFSALSIASVCSIIIQ